MDTLKTIGKWSYLVGLVVAVITGLVSYSADWLTLVLAVLAVLAGLFFADPKELTNYGVRFLTLFAVAAALDAFPILGPYVTAVAAAMVAFFAPIILTVLLVFNVKQAVDWIQSK